MPSGTAISVAVSVMSSVPTIAAFMPGPGRRGASWMSLVNQSGKAPDTIDQPLRDDRDEHEDERRSRRR